MGGRLTTRIDDEDGVVTLRLLGEFDMESHDAALAALGNALGARARRLVVDLNGLDFIDSTGVRFLLQARKQAIAQGYDVVFRFLDSVPVRRVLEMSGLTHVFDG